MFSPAPPLSSQTPGSLLSPGRGIKLVTSHLQDIQGSVPDTTESARHVKLNIELISPCLLGRRGRAGMGFRWRVLTTGEPWPWLPCDFLWRVLGYLGPSLPTYKKKSHDLVRRSQIKFCTEFISKSWRNTWLFLPRISITFVFDAHHRQEHWVTFKFMPLKGKNSPPCQCQQPQVSQGLSYCDKSLVLAIGTQIAAFSFWTAIIRAPKISINRLKIYAAGDFSKRRQ